MSTETEVTKIAVIGANEFQRPLIRKIREMGYEAHVFAWKDGSVGAADATCFYPISIVDKDEILSKCREIGVSAVATIASDLAAITVQYLAEELGLPGNSKKCQEKSTNKYKMRKAFSEAGIPVPMFTIADTNNCLSEMTAAGMEFPLIVKPTDRSGSRAVTYVTNEEELLAAVDDAVACSFQRKAIIESFIEGDEYSCECVSYHGTHHFLATTKKYTTGYPHYIETAHLEPSGLTDETNERVKDMIFRALDALEVTEGASHSEFRIDSEGNIRIIEIGARMGGDCIGSHLVWLANGYDFLKMTVQCALGEEPDLTPERPKRTAYIRFVYDAEDYAVYCGIRDHYAGNLVESFGLDSFSSERTREVVDSASRYGYYILTCETYDELERMMGREELDEDE